MRPSSRRPRSLRTSRAPIFPIELSQEDAWSMVDIFDDALPVRGGFGPLYFFLVSQENGRVVGSPILFVSRNPISEEEAYEAYHKFLDNPPEY